MSRITGERKHFYHDQVDTTHDIKGRWKCQWEDLIRKSFEEAFTCPVLIDSNQYNIWKDPHLSSQWLHNGFTNNDVASLLIIQLPERSLEHITKSNNKSTNIIPNSVDVFHSQILGPALKQRGSPSLRLGFIWQGRSTRYPKPSHGWGCPGCSKEWDPEW